MAWNGRQPRCLWDIGFDPECDRDCFTCPERVKCVGG